MSAPREERPVLGFLLAALAFVAFAWTDTSAKLLVGAGLPVIMVAFARYAVNFILVLAYFLPREGLSALRSEARTLQIIRGVVLLAGTCLNFWALKYLPLTTTIPIFFATPLVVCVLSVPMLGEKVGLRRYLAVIAGFVGVLIIVRPGGLVFHWAMVLSISATIMASLYFIFTRMLAGKDDMPVSQIYASGIAAIALLPFGIANWEAPGTTVNWFFLVLAGASAGFGHSVLTLAYRYQEASKLAPVVYTQIITIALISWLVFGDIPDGWTIVGTAVIILSGTYVWLRDRQTQSALRD